MPQKGQGGYEVHGLTEKHKPGTADLINIQQGGPKQMVGEASVALTHVSVLFIIDMGQSSQLKPQKEDIYIIFVILEDSKFFRISS